MGRLLPDELNCKIAAAIGILVSAVGFLVIVGWVTGVGILTSIHPGWATMKPNTALGFMLAGAGLFLSAAKPLAGRGGVVGTACSVATMLLGLATLGEYVFDVDLGIDQLILVDTATPRTAFPGRMALMTTINFTLIGSALALRQKLFPSSPWSRWAAEILAILAIVSSYIAIVGYLYGVSALYTVGPYSSVALHTAVLLLFLGAGVLLEETGSGLMRLIASPHAGGRAARRLLPFALIAPPAIGWLRLEGQRLGLYGLEFGLALVVVTLVAIFVTVILSTVSSLDDADRVRRQEIKFRGLLEAAPDAMVIANRDGRIVLVNHQTERLYGYRQQELVGQPVELLVPEHLRAHHASYRARYMTAPRARAMGAQFDLHGRRKDGTEFPVEVSLGSLDTEDGVLVSSAIRDITSRKQLQAELISAKQHAEAASRRAEQANLSKSRFLAAASHDLRQPLQSIALFGGMLRKTTSDPRSRSLIDKLDMSLHAMSHMLDTLLELNQLEAGVIKPVMEDFPIGELLSRLHGELRHHAEAKGLELRLVSSSAVVRSDPTLLAQIVRNLISNAVKYTDRGKILLGCRRRGKAVRVSVVDTGIGIADDQLAAIFDEFHQLDNPARDRQRGLGLGLAIVQQLAVLMDLPVDVRSILHKGSVFSVDVPLGRPSQCVSALPREPAARMPAMVILLVEDDSVVRESLQVLLEFEGHRVIAAGDGDAALAQLAGAAYRPDVIVSDFNLPGGLTGLALIAEIRRRLGVAIPAILLTGDIMLAHEDLSGTPHCILLQKPADIEAVEDALRAVPLTARAKAEV